MDQAIHNEIVSFNAAFGDVCFTRFAKTADALEQRVAEWGNDEDEESFTRHFYKLQALRTLEEISANVLALEKEAQGLLGGLLKTSAKT